MTVRATSSESHAMNKTFQERFWEKVEKSDHCWIWKAAKNAQGYGSFWTGRVDAKAHHIAWMLANGNAQNRMYVS